MRAAIRIRQALLGRSKGNVVGGTLALLALSACTTGSIGSTGGDTGGDDPDGSTAGDSAGPSSDAGMSAHELRAEARPYARDDIACTGDADCCVVIDYCPNEGYVVGAADRSTVRDLLGRAFDLRLEDPHPEPVDQCNTCVPPLVSVGCGPAGFCVGQVVNGPGVGQDHCGNEPSGELCDGACSPDIDAGRVGAIGAIISCGG